MLASGGYGSHLEPDELRRVVCEEAQALTDGRIRAPASIAIQLRERIDGATVLTHSNSATVREAFSHDEPTKVLCTVSNPVEEGRTLVAELTEAGIDAELVEDAEAPGRIKETDVVLLRRGHGLPRRDDLQQDRDDPAGAGGARRRSAGRRRSRGDQAGAGTGQPRRRISPTSSGSSSS